MLDTEKFLSSLNSPWRELMAAWLEYKRTRRESYTSELGAKKCLTMLRSLSGNNPAAAAAIIDRSVANNWAGLFPLPGTPRYIPLGFFSFLRFAMMTLWERAFSP